MTTRETWAQLARHQASAAIASAFDFAVMIALVRFGKITPPVATFVGAGCGAILNFTLGRRWAFRAGDAPVAGQAARYALVSAMSALWNALGEWLAIRLGAQYVVARIFVSLVVGLAWNYPMQRVFVFARANQ